MPTDSGCIERGQARLEKLSKDKRSNLLQRFVKYGFQKFYTVDLEGPTRGDDAPSGTGSSASLSKSDTASGNTDSGDLKFRLRVIKLFKSVRILQGVMIGYNCVCPLNVFPGECTQKFFNTSKGCFYADRLWLHQKRAG
jgi:hypothetical protein